MNFHSGTAEKYINIFFFMKYLWNFFLFPVMDFERYIRPSPLELIRKTYQQIEVKFINQKYG